MILEMRRLLLFPPRVILLVYFPVYTQLFWYNFPEEERLDEYTVEANVEGFVSTKCSVN